MNEVKIVISGENKAGPAFREATGQARGLRGALAGVASVAGGMLTATAITAGARALAGQIGSVISEATEAQQVSAQLDAVLKSTGGAAGMSAAEVRGLAEEMSRVTTFEDDAVLKGQNLLLTFTKVGKDVFPAATATMLDMSTALGQDVSSSAIQLGKALNDPVRGMNALRRVGVSFTNEQEEMIKKLVESGDVLGAQKVILGELTTEFGGSAQEAAGTFGGRVQQLKNQFGEMKEELGAALLPTLTSVVGFMSEKMPGVFDRVREAVRTLKDFVGPLATAFRDAFSGKSVPADGIAGAAGRAGAALRMVVDFVRNNWPQIKTIAQSVFEAFRVHGQIAFNTIMTVVTTVGPPLMRLFEKLANEVGPVVADILGRLKDLFIELQPTIQDIVTNVSDFVAELIDWATESGVIETTMDGIKTTVDLLAPIVEDLAKGIAKLTKELTDHKPVLISVAIAFGVLMIVLNPIPAAIFGIIFAVGLLSQHWDTIKAKTSQVWGFIKNFLRNNWQEIVSIAAMILMGPAGLVVLFSTNAFGIRDKVVNAFREIPGLITGLAGRFFEAAKEVGKSLLDGLKNAITNTSGFVGDIGGAVSRAVKNTVNSVIGKINSALEFTIPVPFGPDVHIDPPDIPKLARGGRIPGSPSQGVLAMLHGGEEVLNLEQQRRVRRMVEGAGGVVQHFHVNTVVIEGDARAGLAALGLAEVAG